MLNEPRALKEIHDIRLNNYEKTKGMTVSERNKRVHDNTREIIDSLGIKIIPLPEQSEELKQM